MNNYLAVRNDVWGKKNLEEGGPVASDDGGGTTGRGSSEEEDIAGKEGGKKEEKKKRENRAGSTGPGIDLIRSRQLGSGFTSGIAYIINI